MRCRSCNGGVHPAEVTYKPGQVPATMYGRKKCGDAPPVGAGCAQQSQPVQNLVNLVGDRWTANVIALSFHGLTRFDQISPRTASRNILADRLRFPRG